MAFSATENGLTFNWLEQFKNRGQQELFSGRLSEDNFTDTMGKYDSLVGKTDGSLEKFNKTQKEAKNGIVEYRSQLNGTAASYDDYNAYLDKTNEVQNKVTVGQKAMSFGKNMFAGALNMGVSMLSGIAVSAAISGIITLIDNWVNRSEKLIQKGREAKQEIDSLNDNYKSHKDTVQNVVDTYDDLRTKVDQTTNENKGLSSSQYEEFLNQNNELASMFPTLVSGYDSQGNAIINLGNSATTATDKLKTLMEVERESVNLKISDKAQDQYKGTAEEVKDIEKEIDTLKNLSKERQELSDSLSKEDLRKNFEEGLFEINPNSNDAQKALDTLRKFLDEEQIEYIEGFKTIGQDKNGEPINNTIFTIPEMTGEQKDKITKQFETYAKDVEYAAQDTANQSLKEIKFKENEIAAKWAELAPTVSAMLQSSPNFNELDTTLQDGITNMIPNLDYSTIQSKFDGDIESFVRNGILAPIATATPEVQNAYKELFTLEEDSSDMSIKDWAAKRDSLIKEITGGDKGKTKDFLQNLGYLDSNGKGKIKQQLDLVEDSLDKAEGVRSTLREMTRDDLEIAYDIILNDDDNAIETLDQLKTAIKSRKDEIDAEQYSLDSMTSYYEKAIEYQDNLNAAMVSSVSSKGLSSDDIANVNSMFSNIDGYDDKTKAILFEKTANGVHLNSEALRELQTVQEATTKAGFIKSREKILDQLKQEQEQLKTLTKDTDEYNTAQNKISGLKTDLSNLDLLAAQYDGLTSAYQKWVNAQSNGEEGDMYDSFQTAIDRGKELYKEGLVGTNEFRAIADLFAYGDQSNASVDELVSAYENASPTIKKFFTEGADGASKFLDTMSKTTDETGKYFAKWETVTDENGKEQGFWKFNAGNDDDLAQQLGIDVEAVQAIMRKLKDYGFDVVIGDTTGIDSYTDGLEELETKATEARERLNQMESSEVFDSTALKSAIDFDVDSLNVDQLKDKITEINDTRPSLDVDSEAYNDAQAIIDRCQARIDEINGTTAILTYDVEGTDSIDDLETKKSQLEDYQATLDVDSSRYEETSALIDQIQGKIDTLNASSGATTDIGGNFNQLQDGYQKVQQLQSALQELANVHASPTVSADGVADVEAKVQNAAQSIASLPKEVRIQMGIIGDTPEEIANQLMTEEVEIPVIFQQTDSNIDTNADEKKIVVNEVEGTKVEIATGETKEITVNEVQGTVIEPTDKEGQIVYNEELGSTIQPSTKNAKVVYDSDTSEPDGYQPDDKDATVIYDTDTSKPDSYQPSDKSATVNYGVNSSSVDSWVPPAKSGTVTYKVSMSGTLPLGFGVANGTAHVAGTASVPKIKGSAFSDGTLGHAYDSGDWGVKQGGNALVGELGQEICVRNGRFFTIGDTGAEFFKTQPGDIIFNHLQSKAILEKGYVTGRGKVIGGAAHVDGTAYSSGSGKFLGGIANNGGKTAGGGGSNKAAQQTANNTAKTAGAAQSAANSAEKTADAMDYITIQLDNLSRTTDKYLKYAEGANTLAGSLENYQSAINNIFRELTANQQGYDRYIAQANSVQLDEGIKGLVRDGTIDIREYDEDTKKKIDEYQKWFEAATKCSEALVDLRLQQKELAKEKLDKIVDHYDLRKDLYSNTKSKLDSRLDLRASMGYSQVSSYQKAVYTSQRSQEKLNLKKNEEALAKYRSELNKQMKAGLIKKNSPAWYEAQQQIQDYKNAIYESKTAINDLNTQIRTIDFTRFQNAVDKAARWVDKLSSVLDLKEARGKTLTEADYKKQVSANNDQISKLYTQRSAFVKEQGRHAVNSEKYQELAEQIANCDSEVLSLLVHNAELENQMRDSRWKPFNDEQASKSFRIDEVDNLLNMIDSKMLIDEDSGNLTSKGFANLALIAEGMDLQSQKVADYRKTLEKLEAELKSGNITQDEYNEQSREFIEIIQNSINNIQDYKDSIVDLYITQQEKQNDLLQDEIKLRKEALNKKKEYYDYDRKLSAKNKDINTLKAQVAALEGVSSAAGRAELARLKEQLAQAEEEKRDIMVDHETTKRTEAYDDLSENATKALEDLTKAVQNNADVQLEVITSMLGILKSEYASAFSEIADMVESSGLVITDSLSKSLNDYKNESSTSSKVDSALQSGGEKDSSSTANNIDTSKITTGNSTTDKAEKAASTKESTSNRKVVSLTLDQKTASIKVGKSTTIKASYLPSDATTNFKWKSSNTSVATVSSSGKVSGKKAGTAVITCSDTPSGKSATCTITVTKVSSTTLNQTRLWASASTSAAKITSLATGAKVNISQTTTDSKGTKWYKVSSGGKTGWVNSSNIKKYAKGTMRSDDELAEINEHGSEMVFRYDGHDYTNLTYGSKVLTAQQTENLVALSQLKSSEVIKNLVPSANTASITMQPTSISVGIDALIGNIEHMDKSTVSDLEKRIVPLVTQQLVIELKKLGFK